MKTNAFQYARLGSVSHGTLRTEDLLNACLSTLQSLQLRNGDFLALPENRAMRDRVARVIGEIQDAFADDGETLKNEDDASELLNEDVFDVLNEFAPPYAYFGAQEGDGAEFGFWASVESAKENCEFVSVSPRASAAFKRAHGCDSEDSERPAADFRGEWLHINDHGNCTLYVREDDASAREGYTDREVWGIV